MLQTLGLFEASTSAEARSPPTSPTTSRPSQTQLLRGAKSHFLKSSPFRKGFYYRILFFPIVLWIFSDSVPSSSGGETVFGCQQPST